MAGINGEHAAARRQTNQRIQVLRAMAMVAVVMCHTDPEGMPGVLVRCFCNYGVGVFVAISGYLTPEDFDYAHAWKRIRHLLLPYLIWSVIYAFYDHDFSHFFQDLLIGNCCTVYYYLIMYMKLTLAAPLLSGIHQSRYAWLCYLVSPISIAVLYIIHLCGRDLIYPYTLLPATMWFSFFYFGYALRHTENHKILDLWYRKKFMLALFGGTFLLQVGEGLYWYSHGSTYLSKTQARWSCFLFAMVVCYIGLIWVKHSIDLQGFRYVVYLGNISFGVYLIHKLVMYVMDGLDCFVYPLNFWITLICSIVVVAAMHELLPRKLRVMLGM